MAVRSVVTSFLEYEGKILILRRSERVGSYRGRWAGVSGSIDSGHSPEEQARVEIREETGLTDDDVVLLATGEPLAVADAANGYHWLVHPFRFRVLHPDRIQTDWEHVERRWIDPSDLATFETVPSLIDAWQRVAGGQG
ncbi:MAG TPA: NUDIX pyrophosphatase [Chloroflexota bacterium]|nr:NUDIX pyrophosphatase [Chloroflexota bacterium]